jgi:hypothetical protein
MKKKIKTKKQEANESVDFLEQVEKGGPSFVQKYRKEEKIQKKAEDDQVANYLETSRNAQKTYRNKLASYAQDKLEELLEWAKDWKVDAVATHGDTIYIYGKAHKTQEGIQLIIKSPKGNVYMRGILTCYEPQVDMHAIEVLVEQAENSMDAERGLLIQKNKVNKTEGGIILPDGYNKPKGQLN